MFTRSLGKSGISVSALGLGCWAIGGPFWRGQKPVGWGKVDDRESIRAIHRALELGVTLFDTADIYGCGHSERVLGQALAGRRHEVVIATKFGQTFDETTRQGTGQDVTPEYIRRACDASLRRLNVDVIDLYQLHIKDVSLEQAPSVRDALEDLTPRARFAGMAGARTMLRVRVCSRRALTALPFSSGSTSLRAISKHCWCVNNSTLRASTAVRWRWDC